MRSRFMPVLFVLLGLMILGSPSSPSAEAPDPAQLERWITQLGSKQFAEREAASHALDALGEAALGGLRKTRTHEDAEISRRADLLIGRIERRVEMARLLTARKVRLVYRETRVLDALQDAAKKTGFPLDYEGDRTRLAQRTLTFDTGEVTVWEALEQFTKAAGLTERLAPTNRNRDTARWEVQNGVMVQGRVIVSSTYLDARSPYDTRIVFSDGKPAAWPTHQAGAVRVRAVPAQPTPRPTSQPAGGNELQFQLEVTPQPQLTWQGVFDVRILRALDEHGQELVQPLGTAGSLNAANMLWARNGAVFVADLELLDTGVMNRILPVRLQSGKQPTKVLKEVQGVVSAHVEVGPEPLIIVENVEQAVGRVFSAADGAGLKVVGVTREEARIKVRVELQQSPTVVLGGAVGIRGGRRAFAGRAMNAREAEASGLPLTLHDARGERVPLTGIESPQGVIHPFGFPQEMTLTFEPKAGQAEAAKLIYTGRRTVGLEIPFTLKEVPLP